MYSAQQNPSVAELTWRRVLGHARIQQNPKNKALNEGNKIYDQHMEFILHLDENEAIARGIANPTGIEIVQEGKYLSVKHWGGRYCNFINVWEGWMQVHWFC